MTAEFAGRVAVVTGGTRGIGRAIALAYARHGAAGVVVGYRNDATAAGETVDALRALGCEAEAIAGDVAVASTARALAQAAHGRWGRIDAWVNNAGITADGPFLRMPEARWRRVLDTNLEGTRHGCAAALETMFRQRSGAIVNVTSVVGMVAHTGQANYAAAKAAAIGLTRTLALDYGRRGVRINAIAPGYIQTDLTGAIMDDAGRADLLERVPLGRLGRPDDVAELAVFLSSDRASYITGSTFVVDGGLTTGIRLEP